MKLTVANIEKMCEEYNVSVDYTSVLLLEKIVFLNVDAKKAKLIIKEFYKFQTGFTFSFLNSTIVIEGVNLEWEYDFLNTDIYGDNGEVVCVSKGRIEDIAISDTYGSYGQSVTPEDAGDCFILLTPKAVKLANKAYHDYHESSREERKELVIFETGETYSCYEFGEHLDEITHKLKSGKDYEMERAYCSGFNYHDGNNWQTVVVETPNGEPSVELINDQENILQWHIAIARMEHYSEGNGITRFSSAGFWIDESNWADAWERYTILENEENN